MARLIPISELVRDRNYDLGNDYHSLIGQTVYGQGGEKVGTVREAMTDDSGQIRYLIVDVGGWFSAKEVMVPVGMARIEDDGVFFDSLNRDQVKNMSGYVAGQDYEYEAQVSDERVLRGVENTRHAAGSFNYSERDDTLFQTPQRLQLLEERLQVNKDRYVTGQVQVGKHVETRTENVTVPLEREEIVIERHVVTDARPVSGDVTLGAATETMEVTLEAERAQVSKQAFVTEEVEIGKRTVTEQQTVSETVGREVLDVSQTGQVNLHGNETTLGDGRMHDGRNVAERAADVVKDAVDPLDGKIDRR